MERGSIPPCLRAKVRNEAGIARLHQQARLVSKKLLKSKGNKT